MKRKTFSEMSGPQTHHIGFNFGALLNQQIAVVLEDEAEDEANEAPQKRKPRVAQRTKLRRN